jgi:hypothetical protein
MQTVRSENDELIILLKHQFFGSKDTAIDYGLDDITARVRLPE